MFGLAHTGAFRGHPPLGDIDRAATSCASDEASFLADSGTVTNHSSDTSDYIIYVDFDANGVRVADGVTFVNHVSTGSHSKGERVNSLTELPAPATCVITNVKRSAS